MAVDFNPLLIVEDEFLILDLVQKAFADSGFAVVVASSGEEAIGILNIQSFQCRTLITDINLGSEVTGWMVAKRAREVNDRVPVVYMSGGNGHEMASNGVSNSVLLRKPFICAHLVKAVSKMLSACRL